MSIKTRFLPLTNGKQNIIIPDVKIDPTIAYAKDLGSGGVGIAVITVGDTSTELIPLGSPPLQADFVSCFNNNNFPFSQIIDNKGVIAAYNSEKCIYTFTNGYEGLEIAYCKSEHFFFTPIKFGYLTASKMPVVGGPMGTHSAIGKIVINGTEYIPTDKFSVTNFMNAFNNNTFCPGFDNQGITVKMYEYSMLIAFSKNVTDNLKIYTDKNVLEIDISFSDYIKI